MAGFQTFNSSHKPLWVTIYEEPAGSKMDWGEVAPHTWQQWGSQPYSRSAYYRVRGEWPMHGASDDVALNTRLDGPFPFKPLTFVVWNQVAWWTRPCWRTVNKLDRAVWITIYSHPGDRQIDWGEVGPGQHHDWFAGEYGPHLHYRIRAHSPRDGHDVDVEVAASFEGGWGEAVLAKQPDGNGAWHIERNPSGTGSIRPPKEPDIGGREDGC